MERIVGRFGFSPANAGSVGHSTAEAANANYEHFASVIRAAFVIRTESLTDTIY